MEMLQQIIDMVKGMPELAIWVLAGLLLYKIVFIGPWFGIVRLLILKTYDWAVSKKQVTEVVEQKLYSTDGEISKYLISDDKTKEQFFKLLGRIKNLKTRIKTNYLFDEDIEKAISIIDAHHTHQAHLQSEGNNE